MRVWTGILAVLLSLLLPLALLAGCGGGSDGNGGATTTKPPTEKVITIGNLTDLTGVSSSAQAVINMSLDDLIGYFNDEGMIPGIRLKVETYDGQFDPAKDIPGYEWLKERGADLMVTAVTSTPLTLMPRVNQDKMLLFTLSGALETLSPPGYVFAPATLAEHEGLTLIKWIGEHDWDYKANGPATIGAGCWNEPNSLSFVKMLEAYAKAHPEQFKWAGTYLTQVGTFTWATQVRELKDCDYVFTNAPIASFLREYRLEGGTGKLIGGGPHIALMKVIDDANLWDEIDGMLFITPSKWWGEDDQLVKLREKLLYENHPKSAEEVKRMGGAYNALDNYYVVLDIIRKAAATVGPENVDSQALYEAAQSYSLTIDGVERYSFSNTKRDSCNYYGIYQASKEKRDLFRIDPEWQPKVTEP